jgi:predicted acyl esterase
MRIRTEFPYEVREHLITIPMRDGVRLAGRMWLPVDAEKDPVPGIVELHPYRFDAPDSDMRYVAGFGYATANVSLRGSGNSEGVLLDEYTRQEHEDIEDVIAWLAAQPWCTSAVGMTGLSWSGFNTLQMAARRPPALRAVIAGCATDNRFADDMHYAGGALLRDNFTWGGLFQGVLMLPPEPSVVGPGWRESWRERIANAPLAIEAWMRHQRRDDYWSHSSIDVDYAAIECPVLLVGGWADQYTRPMLRALGALTAPAHAIIGEWGHQWPQSREEPYAIGYLAEAVRWWDRWLKGLPNGVEEEPRLRAFVTDASGPNASGPDASVPDGSRTGRWVGENWPPPASRSIVRPLLAAEASGGKDDAPLTLRDGAWTGLGAPGLLQRTVGEFTIDEDDRASLAFTFAPLPAEIELLGIPAVELEFVAPGRTTLAVRLCQVRPDGGSRELAIGIWNAAAHPAGTADGVRHATIELSAVGRAIPAGDRLRVTVSGRHWAAWPAPETGDLTVVEGARSLVSLPVREAEEAERPVVFGEPETGELLSGNVRQLSGDSRTTIHQVLPVERFWETGSRARSWEIESVTSGASSLRTEESEAPLERASRSSRRQRVHADVPAIASDELESSTSFARGDWRVRLETRIHVTSTADRFLLSASADAYEGEARIATRTWSAEIPRDPA